MLATLEQLNEKINRSGQVTKTYPTRISIIFAVEEKVADGRNTLFLIAGLKITTVNPNTKLFKLLKITFGLCMFCLVFEHKER